MKTLLALVPLFALVAGLMVYRHNGKREILRFDLVQFFYAFVLMPILYIWFKGVMFFLLESQFQVLVSSGAFLFWDMVYSLLFLFLYAFTVIHSLTKSFNLKKKKDPLYDLFEHSEYYHFWVTHTVMFIIGMAILLLLAILNAWLDLPWVISQLQFYGLLVLAPVMAALVFKAFLISDFGDFRFVKLMKLCVAVFFVLHVIVYAVFEPAFASLKTMYWYQFNFFLSLTLIGMIYPSESAGKGFRHGMRHGFRRFWQKLIGKR